MKVRLTFEVSFDQRRILGKTMGRPPMTHEEMKKWALSTIEATLDDYSPIHDEDGEIRDPYE